LGSAPDPAGGAYSRGKGRGGKRKREEGKEGRRKKGRGRGEKGPCSALVWEPPNG